jgi:hypothetical protein
MTVSTSSPRVVYDGDGTTTVFAIPFKFLDNSHITVFLRTAVPVQNDWTDGTEYTLTGAGNPAGGTLTVKTTPTDYTPKVGERLIILRVVPNTQETQYVENDDLPSATLENDLDKRTMASQQIDETLARALTAPEADTLAGNFELPLDAARASKFLAFDALGNPIASLGTAAGQPVPFSSFGQDWVTLADAAAGLTFLGAQADLLNALTADGDILIRSGGAIARLAKANDGDALVLASGLPAWAKSSLPRGYLSGLTLSNGTDTAHDIDIAPGDCRSEDNQANIIIPSAVGKRLDASWAAGGTPAAPTGGLSSSLTLTADTIYYVHAIIVGGASEIGFDSSIAAANLITDHGATAFRLVGYVITDSTANIVNGQFMQVANGRKTYTFAPQAATGSNVDWVGIDPDVTKIIVAFRGVAPSASADDLLVQLGDSGGFETAGYLSSGSRAGGTTALTTSTAGFAIYVQGSTALVSANMMLTGIGGNAWVSSHAGKQSSGNTAQGGGDKALSGVLDRVRVTMSGVETFTAGTIQIFAE